MTANMCPICMESVGKRNGYRHKQQHNRKTPCSAVFHKQCIVKASTELRMKKNAACPCCRLPAQHKEIESLAGRTIETNNDNALGVQNQAPGLGRVARFGVRNASLMGSLVSTIISLSVLTAAMIYHVISIGLGTSIKDCPVYRVYTPQGDPNISLAAHILSHTAYIPAHIVSLGLAKMIFLRNRQKLNYCMFVGFSALCSVCFSNFAKYHFLELMNR